MKGTTKKKDFIIINYIYVKYTEDELKNRLKKTPLKTNNTQSVCFMVSNFTLLQVCTK